MHICFKLYDEYRICQRIYDYIFSLEGTKMWNQARWIQSGYLDCPSCNFPIHCIMCGSLMDAIPPHDWAVCSNEDCGFGKDGLPEWARH